MKSNQTIFLHDKQLNCKNILWCMLLFLTCLACDTRVCQNKQLWTFTLKSPKPTLAYFSIMFPNYIQQLPFTEIQNTWWEYSQLTQKRVINYLLMNDFCSKSWAFDFSNIILSQPPPLRPLSPLLLKKYFWIWIQTR